MYLIAKCSWGLLTLAKSSNNALLRKKWIGDYQFSKISTSTQSRSKINDPLSRGNFPRLVVSARSEFRKGFVQGCTQERRCPYSLPGEYFRRRKDAVGKGGRGFSTTVGLFHGGATWEAADAGVFSSGDPEGAPPQDNGPIRTHRTFYPPFHHHRRQRCCAATLATSALRRVYFSPLRSHQGGFPLPDPPLAPVPPPASCSLARQLVVPPS